MTKHKLVIVSNRLPVNVSRQNGSIVFEASNGGLATAMASLDHSDMVWVGWPGIASDDLTAVEKKEIADELKKYNCVPVYLSRKEVELFYEGYANDTLWPLFHYFQAYTTYRDDYWKAYCSVNKLYMKAVERCATTNSKIWIHDYHLMLLPALVRNILPDASIGFFLHIPFPSFEIYRLLPERKEILHGLLGADLIGFHVYDYARHFMSSCLRLLGLANVHGTMHYDGRTIKIDAYPIGIDFPKFRRSLKDTATTQAIAKLKETYKNQKLILSVDRLDYSKGIPERLEAFRALLEEHPEYIGKIKLVMIAVPSRTEVETYQQLRDTIEQAVSRINGEYGTVDWAPISYQFQNRPFHEILALYAIADIALVTPLRDGMNLVAKEYIAAKQNQPGVLLLSEMTGAIDELPEAISINPNDTKSLKRAIRQALKMPKKEQLQRLETMQKRLASYSVKEWGNDFMNDLAHAGAHRDSMHRKKLSSQERAQLLRSFKSAKSRLIILDYDGTVQPYHSSPSPTVARPSQKLLATLKRLSKHENTTLAIVSGRPRLALESWFGDTSFILIAEHGAWTRYDGQWTKSDVEFESIKKRIRPLLERTTIRTAGSLIEEKDYALVWHYRNVPPELAYVRSRELQRELEDLLVDSEAAVMGGHSILEIKPHQIHKGYAASELEAIYQPDFILCAGDDYTDEDMFEELPDDSYTIRIGPGETNARHQLEGVSQMIALLEELSQQK